MPPAMSMPTTPRERILTRLRQSRAVVPLRPAPPTESDADWLARQPPIADLAARFVAEQQSTGGEVRRVASWAALPEVVVPWLAEAGVRSIITGREPRLEPLRERVAAHGGLTLRRYERPLEEQRAELFATDCGITTSRGAIAETGSIVLVPTPAEPRLLSLAPEVHLAIVERTALHPTLAAFIQAGSYQAELPANLVLVSGASRTADIELVLAMGVHGPKRLLVALIDAAAE
jgi:L-lactate dehydrogenase complex protein LldG